MVTLKVRQSHARTYKKCKRKYKLQVIDNLVPLIKHPALSIGTATHAGRANFLVNRDPALALKTAFASMEMEISLFPSLLGNVHGKECGRRPCTECSRQMVLEMVAYYCQEFDKRYPDGCIKVLATELSFEVPIAQFEELEMFAVGTIDADAIYLEKYRVNWEFKTTKTTLAQYFDQEYMSDQHIAYSLAQSILTGETPYGTLLDVIKKPGKEKGPECDELLIPINSDDIIEFKRDTEELLKEIAYSMEHDYFPPTKDSCFGIYGRCEFFDACKSKFDPHVMRNKYMVVEVPVINLEEEK